MQLSAKQLQDFTEVYDFLMECVRDGLRISREQGKSFLLLATETHDDLNEIFLKDLLYDICKRNGIRTVAIESSREEVDLLMEAGRNGTLQGNPINDYSALYSPLNTGMDVVPIENYEARIRMRQAALLAAEMPPLAAQNYLAPCDKEREAHMVEAFLNLDRDCMASLGAMHMQAIKENNQLSAQYHVMRLNLGVERFFEIVEDMPKVYGAVPVGHPNPDRFLTPREYAMQTPMHVVMPCDLNKAFSPEHPIEHTALLARAICNHIHQRDGIKQEHAPLFPETPKHTSRREEEGQAHYHLHHTPVSWLKSKAQEMLVHALLIDKAVSKTIGQSYPE